MISRLTGTVVSLSGKAACIDIAGVGYEVICSSAFLSSIEMETLTTVVVHTDVREDAIRLYGFIDQLEKQVFLLLLKVSGVGAKTASDIISSIDKTELLRIIGNGNLQELQRIKGIGKKTAERIIVELRDRVSDLVNAGLEGGTRQEGMPYREAIEALMALGFARKDAEKAVQKVEQQHSSSMVEPGEIVREALRFV